MGKHISGNTQQDLFNAILDLHKKIDDNNTETLKAIGELSRCFTAEIAKHEVEIELHKKYHSEDLHPEIVDLQKRNQSWDIINSVGIAVAGILAWFRGG